MDKVLVVEIKPTMKSLSMEDLASLDKSIVAINSSASRASEKMWEAMGVLLTQEGGEK